MKIGILHNDNFIYIDDTEVKDNIGDNIELKEYILDLAMEYLDNEKVLSRYNHNKKNDVVVKKLEYVKKEAA